MKKNISQGNLEKILKQSRECLSKGNRAGAREVLEQAIEMSPQNEMVWLYMAYAQETKAAARPYLEKVLAVNPNHLDARKQLGKILDDDLEQAYTQIRDTEHTRDQIQSEIASLRSEFALLQSQVDELKNRSSELNEEVQQLTNKKIELHEQIEDLKKRLEASTSVTSQIQKAQIELERIHVQIKDEEREREQIRSGITTLRLESASLLGQMDEVRSRSARLVDDANQLTSEKVKLLEQIERLKVDIKKYEDTIKCLSEQQQQIGAMSNHPKQSLPPIKGLESIIGTSK